MRKKFIFFLCFGICSILFSGGQFISWIVNFENFISLFVNFHGFWSIKYIMEFFLCFICFFGSIVCTIISVLYFAKASNTKNN